MLDPIVALLTALYAAASGPLFIPLVVVAALPAVYHFMFGKAQEGQARSVAVAIGAAILLGAPRIATAIQGVIPK